MSDEPKVKVIKETDNFPEIWVKLSDSDSNKVKNLIEIITR